MKPLKEGTKLFYNSTFFEKQTYYISKVNKNRSYEIRYYFTDKYYDTMFEDEIRNIFEVEDEK